MSRPTVVCLTPVKNEEWILERFLAAASLWADVIIVADQHSTDRSREIVSSFEKVQLIENPNPEFNEPERQALLITAARERVPGPRLLLALDADEALSGNFTTSPEWERILAAAPGTSIRLHWANVTPSGQEYWSTGSLTEWGFVDDGTPHAGKTIHSPRVPVRAGGPVLDCAELHFLHLQYIDPARTASKQRWYQCYERLRQPETSPVRLFD
ncbi:MAG: glycosyltransferase family 2 protein, partial [Verrucomicrobiota bacterium]